MFPLFMNRKMLLFILKNVTIVAINCFYLGALVLKLKLVAIEKLFLFNSKIFYIKSI